jgi:hypothetical protein
VARASGWCGGLPCSRTHQPPASGIQAAGQRSTKMANRILGGSAGGISEEATDLGSVSPPHGRRGAPASPWPSVGRAPPPLFRSPLLPISPALCRASRRLPPWIDSARAARPELLQHDGATTTPQALHLPSLTGASIFPLMVSWPAAPPSFLWVDLLAARGLRIELLG